MLRWIEYLVVRWCDHSRMCYLPTHVQTGPYELQDIVNCAILHNKSALGNKFQEKKTLWKVKERERMRKDKKMRKDRKEWDIMRKNEKEQERTRKDERKTTRKDEECQERRRKVGCGNMSLSSKIKSTNVGHLSFSFSPSKEKRKVYDKKYFLQTWGLWGWCRCCVSSSTDRTPRRVCPVQTIEDH